MPKGDWDNISREVVSLFTALTDQSPIHMICLDWNLVCQEFEDEDGWTTWKNDGVNLTQVTEAESVSFIIFSRNGLHEMEYHLDKKPEIKHILETDELSKFKVIKSRHDKIELQIEREKDFIIGKMKFLDSYKFKFEPTQWDYLHLRRQIIVGTKLVTKLLKTTKPVQQVQLKESKSSVSTSHKSLEEIRTKFQVPIAKPPEIIGNDYEESIKNAEEDIKALKKPENRRLAQNALDKMEAASEVIKRCDLDVTQRNQRIKKLKHEKIQIKKMMLRKLEKKVKLDELERKIEMIDRMNEKELKIKTQKVSEFCGLREAILTIRTNEEKLKPKDINLLIDNAMLIETQTKTGEKMQKKRNHYKNDQLQIKDLNKLVESGKKHQWEKYIIYNLKNKIKMEFPPIDQDKCKFNDYGYRQLIELIIESTDFLRIITEVKEVSGFNVVELNYLIRGNNSTLRGIETFCNLLINNEIRFNPVSETDFKYLNIILNSFTAPTKEGTNKIWKIKTENSEIEIKAIFDKESHEWIYAVG